jgi:hypothetical protein
MAIRPPSRAAAAAAEGTGNCLPVPTSSVAAGAKPGRPPIVSAMQRLNIFATIGVNRGRGQTAWDDLLRSEPVSLVKHVYRDIR